MMRLPHQPRLGGVGSPLFGPETTGTGVGAGAGMAGGVELLVDVGAGSRMVERRRGGSGMAGASGRSTRGGGGGVGVNASMGGG